MFRDGDEPAQEFKGASENHHFAPVVGKFCVGFHSVEKLPPRAAPSGSSENQVEAFSNGDDTTRNPKLEAR